MKASKLYILSYLYPEIESVELLLNLFPLSPSDQTLDPAPLTEVSVSRSKSP